MKISKNVTAFFIISILGTVGHFLYEITNNKIIGYFLSVSESTCEHLKLLFFPALFYFIYIYFKDKNAPQNYIPSTVLSLLYGMLMTVTIFYTYKGIIGKNIDFINILIYYIAVLLFLAKRKKLLESNKFTSKTAVLISLFAVILAAFLFFIWSYNPPKLGIFQEPNLS